MPPRQIQSTRRVLISELPILPFLAPRIFSPWLSALRGGRAHGSIPARSKTIGEERLWNSELQAIKQPIQRSLEQETVFGGNSDPQYSISQQSNEEYPTSEDVQGELYRDYPATGSIHSAPSRALEPTRDPRFKKSYSDIWGPKQPTFSAAKVPLQRIRSVDSEASWKAALYEGLFDEFADDSPPTQGKPPLDSTRADIPRGLGVEQQPVISDIIPAQPRKFRRPLACERIVNRKSMDMAVLKGFRDNIRAQAKKDAAERAAERSGRAAELWGEERKKAVGPLGLIFRYNMSRAEENEESPKQGGLELGQLKSVLTQKQLRRERRRQYSRVKAASLWATDKGRLLGKKELPYSRWRRLSLPVMHTELRKASLRHGIKRLSLPSSIESEQREKELKKTRDRARKWKRPLFARFDQRLLMMDNNTSFWNRAFSQLRQEAGLRIRMPSQPECRSKPPLELLDLSRLSDKEKLEESKPGKGKLWILEMISLLRTDPYKALEFLIASCFPPYPPSYAISDSLWFIISRYLDQDDQGHSQNIESLLSILIRLLDHVERDYFVLTQDTIHKILQYLDGNQVARLYDKLVQCNHPLDKHTAAHFITAFAQTRQTEMALDVIRWLRSTNSADFSQSVLESVCSVVLMKENRSPSSRAPSDSEIFGLMLDCGLQPNIITYNILLRNTIEVGDATTARHIYQMMTENHIAPDIHTYSILLNDAKWRSDRVEIDRLLDITTSSNMMNGHIVTDFLHAMFLMAEEDRKAHFAKQNASFRWRDDMSGRLPNPPFKRMLDFYSTYYDTGPLWKIIPDYPGMRASSAAKWHPKPPVLVVMLIALLKELKSPKDISAVYSNFRRYVEEQDPDLVLLSRSTYVYDAAVMAFGRSKETLKACTVVIGDMLSSHAKDSKHIAPSVRTWSILLKAFMDHRQPLAAEKVLNMMRERGINPDQVTWNSLMIGYARMQDITNAVKVIERFENEGWMLDGVGLRGLQRIRDRNVLLHALERHHDLPIAKARAASLVDMVSQNILDARHIPLVQQAVGPKNVGKQPVLRHLRTLEAGEFVFPDVRKASASQEGT